MPITQTCETLFLKYFFRLKLEDSGEDDEGSQIDTFRPAPVRLLLTVYIKVMGLGTCVKLLLHIQHYFHTIASSLQYSFVFYLT